MALTYKENPFFQDAYYRAAFTKLKDRLVNAPLLVYFNPQYKLIVETDALDGVLRGVLLQLQPSQEWHLMAYYLKIIIPAKINYLIYDKEMLAII